VNDYEDGEDGEGGYNSYDEYVRYVEHVKHLESGEDDEDEDVADEYEEDENPYEEVVDFDGSDIYAKYNESLRRRHEDEENAFVLTLHAPL
jgi:hypothetical protein